MALPADLRAVEVSDERSELARETLALIQEAIGDVQPLGDLLSELEETRLGLPAGGRYHLLALLDPTGAPVAAAAGIYLEAVNAGFVTYLAVRADQRRRRLGRKLREFLIEAFRGEALRARGEELAWTVGEVRSNSPWLRTLVRSGRAIPFDLSYFHPWMSLRSEGRYVLYRQPSGDPRRELPPDEVMRLVYGIWRRAYRVRYPTQSETFCYMLRQVEDRETVGVHADFAALMAHGAEGKAGAV
ncbi:MAG TPA: GNAT family N-acetyltransferase [Longimicrobiaceae bacterium]|nr:GNAT family N-acetyltransferase [Longimicrobiaceae bacterium]